MTDFEKFAAFCKEMGLVYEVHIDGRSFYSPDANIVEAARVATGQYQLQFEAEAGNGPACGPVFYFDPDGSFVCQE